MLKCRKTTYVRMSLSIRNRMFLDCQLSNYRPLSPGSKLKLNSTFYYIIIFIFDQYSVFPIPPLFNCAVIIAIFNVRCFMHFHHHEMDYLIYFMHTRTPADHCNIYLVWTDGFRTKTSVRTHFHPNSSTGYTR